MVVSYWWCVATAALGQTDRGVAGNLHQIELIVSSSYIIVMGKLILFSGTVSLGLFRAIWDSICFGPWKKGQCIVWLFQSLGILFSRQTTMEQSSQWVLGWFGTRYFPIKKKNNSSKRKERLGWDRIGSLTIKKNWRWWCSYGRVRSCRRAAVAPPHSAQWSNIHKNLFFSLCAVWMIIVHRLCVAPAAQVVMLRALTLSLKETISSWMCLSTLQTKVYRLIEVIICNHLYSKLYLWKCSLCFGAWTYLLQGWIQIKKKKKVQFNPESD